MSVEQNKAIVQVYFDQVLNQGKLEAIDQHFTHDFQFHITTLPLPVKGREGEKNFVTTLRTAFPDLCFLVDHIIAEGEKVFARWHLEGTHKGDFLGFPPSGNRVVDVGNDIFHLRDGKITEVWVNEDSLGLMQAMGVLPTLSGAVHEEPSWRSKNIPAQPSSPESNKAVVRRYFYEIMNEANERTIEEIISPDFLFTIPTHGPARGPEGEKEEVRFLHTAFPDVHFYIEDEFADDQRVAVRWVARGTHLGDFMGIPPSGRRFWIDGIGSYHVIDGRLVESLVNEDSLNLLVQIGAVQLPSGK